MPGPNPNHHLWRNGRLWWIAFTVIYDGWRQERVRRSLGTADLEEARRLRDDVLHEYAAAPNAEVAALKSQPDAACRLEPETGADTFGPPPPVARRHAGIRRPSAPRFGEAARQTLGMQAEANRV